MDFYCSDDDDDRMEDNSYYSDDDDDRLEDIVSGEEELPDSDVSRRQKTHRILKEEDIRQLQEDDISVVCNVLSVSRSVACTLLYQNKWNPSSVYEKWFERPEVVLSSEEQVNKKICSICFETTTTEDNTILLKTVSAACGHPFCVDCWEKYIRTCIENGTGCLELKCPEPGCKAHPGLDMVDLVSSQADKFKYYQFLYRSYIESSLEKRKWCPAPGCNFAIEFNGGSEGDESFVVMCDCGCRLCWGCGDECHSPLDCETVAEWIKKNNTEAENTTWILAYTKPCPKCRRSIEKNQGCNHMSCSAPCNYHFCWTCLENWDKHGYDRTCNGYSAKEAAEEKNREKAKQYIVRYTHYYERWASNDKSKKMALASLRNARNKHIDRLTETQMQSHSQLEFVVEAWKQIVDCRRVLKWSYAYGYYSMSGTARVRMLFFEHLQGHAETALERLHHSAEKEMGKYLSADGPCDDFNEFREKLVDLTKVTMKYFENLVRALENNLSEVKNVVDVDVDVDVDRKNEMRIRRKMMKFEEEGLF